MLCVFAKSASEVRFGTEKLIGFPRLSVIFHSAAARDSKRCGGGWGGHPRILVGLARC
jgi:hypothetical protein